MNERHEELKRMLEGRQQEILNEVRDKIREVRTEAAVMDHKAPDPGNLLDTDIDEDIEFALIQMKAETLGKINEALARLEEGTYGRCTECREEITESRLRALPFTPICSLCMEARDFAQQRERNKTKKGC
jgi:DnaK suppressor protein